MVKTFCVLSIICFYQPKEEDYIYTWLYVYLKVYKIKLQSYPLIKFNFILMPLAGILGLKIAPIFTSVTALAVIF